MKLLCTEQELDATGVYKITNTVNGKIYVGSSQLFKERINKHVRLLKSGKHFNSHLQSAIDKYGIDFFTFEILECTSIEKRFEREQYHLDILRVYDDSIGYNISPTAEGMTVVPQSVRDKISKANKGTLGPERRARMANPEYKAWFMERMRSYEKSDAHKLAIKENGLKYNKNSMVVRSVEELKILVTEYIAGAGLVTLSEKYGHSKSAISRIFQSPTPPLYKELLTKIGFEGNSIKDLRKPEIQANLKLTQD